MPLAGSIVVSQSSLGVHLAEALEAADLDALLREVERAACAARSNVSASRALLAELERRTAACPTTSTSSRVRLADVRVDRRGEQLGRARRRARRRPSRVSTTLTGARRRPCSTTVELVAVRLGIARERRPRRRSASPASVSTSRCVDHEVGRRAWPKSARSRADQPSNSAARARSGRSAPRSASALAAVAVGDLDVLDPLADEQLLELRLLLDVAAPGCRSSRGRAAARRCRRGRARRAPASAGRGT